MVRCPLLQDPFSILLLFSHFLPLGVTLSTPVRTCSNLLFRTIRNLVGSETMALIYPTTLAGGQLVRGNAWALHETKFGKLEGNS